MFKKILQHWGFITYDRTSCIFYHAEANLNSWLITKHLLSSKITTYVYTCFIWSARRQALLKSDYGEFCWIGGAGVGKYLNMLGMGPQGPGQNDTAKKQTQSAVRIHLESCLWLTWPDRCFVTQSHLRRRLWKMFGKRNLNHMSIPIHPGLTLTNQINTLYDVVEKPIRRGVKKSVSVVPCSSTSLPWRKTVQFRWLKHPN